MVLSARNSQHGSDLTVLDEKGQNRLTLGLGAVDLANEDFFATSLISHDGQPMNCGFSVFY
jgi:hypothetical protein